METRSNGVEVFGNVMRSIEAVRSNTNIYSSGFQAFINVPQLIKRVIWMKMLHQLVAVSDVNAILWGRNAHTIRQNHLQIIGRNQTSNNFLRHFNSIHLLYVIRYLNR